MVAKDVILKKRMIRTACILAGVVCVLAGMAFFLSGYDDDVAAQKTTQQNENNQTASERDMIKAQFSEGFEINNVYEAYIKNHNANFAIDREAATQLLSALRVTYHLARLGVTIAPVGDMSGDLFQLKTATMVKSEVALTFSAVDDHSVYGFIESIQRQFPGIVLIHSFKLSRTGDVSQPILLDLSSHRLASLVTGELAFSWIGMVPKPQDNKNASPPMGGANP
jgi:hypothetical protein